MNDRGFVVRSSRWTALAVIGTALVFAAVARAAVMTGTYKSGNPLAASGVIIKIHARAFSVQMISYREHCTYGSRQISDTFTFQSGEGAALTGKVDRDGHFSGRYTSRAGTTTVSGHVTGRTATVIGKEHGPYKPGSRVHPNSCRGSHTFLATRKRR